MSHGITALRILLGCVLGSVCVAGPVVINEFMASNSGVVKDPQGQYDDWIEFYNPTETALDVGGMCLTDDLGGRDEDYDVLKHNASRVVSGSSASYQAILSLANADLRIPENYQLIQEVLDVPGLIDYLIMNYYVGNWDWAHQNW